jgi:transcriptional regulator with XRE-family HTH domain
MQIRIQQVADVGRAVLAVRKESGVRQDDAAGSAGVSHVFLRELERGKETVQFGRVLQVLEELGIQMVLEIPSDAHARFQALSAKDAAERAERKSPSGAL